MVANPPVITLLISELKDVRDERRPCLVLIFLYLVMVGRKGLISRGASV